MSEGYISDLPPKTVPALPPLLLPPLVLDVALHQELHINTAATVIILPPIMRYAVFPAQVVDGSVVSGVHSFNGEVFDLIPGCVAAGEGVIDVGGDAIELLVPVKSGLLGVVGSAGG